jgi:hypothetical protein
VKLLELQSSPRGEASDSITLTKSFIEACKSDNASIVVDTLNVWHERQGPGVGCRSMDRPRFIVRSAGALATVGLGDR